MKITDVHIERYGAISNLRITNLEATSFLCLVGENGSGKSSLMRVIANAANKVGLGSQQYQLGPQDEVEEWNYSVTFDFRDDFSVIDRAQIAREVASQTGITTESWDGKLTFWSKKVKSGNDVDHQQGIHSEGFKDNWGNLQQEIMAHLDRKGQLKYLYIDANRAYLNSDYSRVDTSFLSPFLDIEAKKALAGLNSIDQYQSWIRETAQINVQSLLQFQEQRHTRDNVGVDEKVEFKDPLLMLSEAVARVLPHIRVVSTDAAGNHLYVYTNGRKVRFDQLSGGERETIFLIGQILRFSVTNGVLLIDEPELHLNPRLTRKLLSELVSRDGSGQLWLATHSYEAVEVAGPSRTIVIEKPSENGSTKVNFLSELPLTLALSTTLGTVGFSVRNRRIVLVEGGGTSLTAAPLMESLLFDISNVEVVRYGSTKRDVISRLEMLRSINDGDVHASEVYAIVDADYESVSVDLIKCADNILHLGCNEFENVFLDPASVSSVFSTAGRPITPDDVRREIRIGMEDKAGKWIWECFENKHNSCWKGNASVRRAVQERKSDWYNSSWEDIVSSQKSWISKIAEIQPKLSDILTGITSDYGELMGSNESWRHCNGKDVLTHVSSWLGFNDEGLQLQRMVTDAWRRNPENMPKFVVELRSVISWDHSSKEEGA